ncbi:MAG: hypothetical protein GQ558_01165, partial [Thermoplasmata archaeon]|nr:hypothetical protein [Thermoplasmata archaeon]
IIIDGEFEDWKGITRFTDRTGDFTNSNLDIESYAYTDDGGDLAVNVQVRGQILNGNVPVDGMDTLIVYFDVDDSDTTGYRLYGFGIDYIIEVRGWDNTIHSASVKEFKSSRDPNDWNGFTAVGSVSAAAKGSQMEIKATNAASWMDDKDARWGMNLQTSELEGDWSPFTLRKPGAIQLRQTSMGVVGEYLMPGQQHNVLRIDLTSYDMEASLTYLTAVSAIEPAPTLLDLQRCDLFLDSNRNGDWDSGDLSLSNDNWGTGDDGGVSFNMEASPLIVPEGTVQRLFLVATVGGSANPGRAVMLHVADPWSVEAEDLPATVIPIEGRASYIDDYQLPITIDGLFEDWNSVFEDNGGNITLHQDPLGDGPRASLDLYHYASFIDPEPGSDRALFYAEIDPTSKVLTGTPTPLDNLQRPSGGGGGGGGGPGPTEPPELFGYDAAQFFINIEGATPSRNFLGIQATHVIDVRGVDGEVRTATLWKYTGAVAAPWVRMVDPVKAAAGVHEVEVALDTANLGNVEIALVMMLGWDGGSDAGSPHVVQDPGEETRNDEWPPGPLPIPEFDDIVFPAVCTLVAYTIVRRRKRA